jgi:hypothetical protein
MLFPLERQHFLRRINGRQMKLYLYWSKACFQTTKYQKLIIRRQKGLRTHPELKH